jgi:hypothetical protein
MQRMAKECTVLTRGTHGIHASSGLAGCVQVGMHARRTAQPQQVRHHAGHAHAGEGITYLAHAGIIFPVGGHLLLEEGGAMDEACQGRGTGGDRVHKGGAGHRGAAVNGHGGVCEFHHLDLVVRFRESVGPKPGYIMLQNDAVRQQHGVLGHCRPHMENARQHRPHPGGFVQKLGDPDHGLGTEGERKTGCRSSIAAKAVQSSGPTGTSHARG